MDTINKLNKLADLQSQRDVVNIHFDELRDSLISPEIRAQLAEIDAERETSMTAIDQGIATLEAEVKTDVLAAGASVKGAYLQAVWNKGRVSWGTKSLDGYAAAHPEIFVFRKEGVPSVSIRRM